MDKRRGRCCLSEDIEGRHHTGMQHTIGGLTDHIINKEIHHWLAVPATSLTELSHTAHRCRLAERHKHTITEQLMTGKGADTQSQKAHFGGERVFFCNTHYRRGVHQSRHCSQPLHHSTSGRGCSGHSSNGTRSGNMWIELRRGCRKSWNLFLFLISFWLIMNLFED